jgi:putative DNA primase/helicase
MNAPHPHQISEAAILAAFADAIRRAGLTPPEQITADGAIHRFASDGRRGKNAGSYRLFMDDTPAGWFQCWRSDLFQTWSSKSANEMTQAEREAHRQRVEAMRQQREADEALRQQEAQAEAARRWEAATPATVHDYLERKGVQAHGARVEGELLLVPMRDADGVLWNVERIRPEPGAAKKGLFGGRRKGLFHLIGQPQEAGPLVICEGYATGASIHEATGYPVAVAFDAGNLQPAALALRTKYPSAALILAADDDWRTEKGNTGIIKATEAAQAVGARLAVPRFPEDCRPDDATDFNDLHQLHGGEAGLEAVRDCFTAALADDAPAPAPAIQIPGEHERPAFLVLDDWHEHDGTRYAPGVWHFGLKPSKGDAPPAMTQQRVCGPLHLEAVTTDTQEGNYGRLLRFKTTTGRWKSWAMPMAMLKGDGADLRGELLGMGLDIAHRGREQLTAYLQHRAPDRVIQCATQTGWAGPEQQAFVLPDAVIGPQADGVTYQSDHAGGDEYTTRGTLAGWQAGTAALAVGNPMLVLALCTAFAGPVLALVGADSGGINTIGASSKGKSSMLFAACSVWGGPSYRRNWRATGNGLESVAALFNDSLLALDEISQCDPREVGETVYMLGNGQGKTRAARTGGARSVARWRVSILSNGERSIVATMEEGGFRTKAGQAVRIIDLPVTDQAHGAWDRLHQYPSGAALSDALRREAETHYGHAGRAFLEHLTRDDHEQVRELLADIKARPEFNAEGGEGQFQRVAARFAVLALAGELATAYGVTGWLEGEAIHAAAVALRLWLGMRDGKTTDAEGPQVVDQVTEFIERHGDSRFSDADDEHPQPVRERAGYWRQRDGERVYLFTAAGMREALKGHDYKRALMHLEQAGMLKTRNKTERIRAIGGTTKKFYTVKPTDAGDAK